ncbi:hypothetical protein LJK88_29145 [Paenibacillus sp. P26]|nr:hypothetical protein LJK88_29145 [Paenibacillus sp. P26]
MAKMNLVLLDEDPYFGEMVSAYIRTSEYAELYGIRVFTTAEQGRLFVEQNTEPLILMVHESLMPLTDAVYGLRPGCTVIISDQAVSGGVLEYPVLCKFQPLDRLLSSITAHYNEYCASRPITGRKGTTITAVYSAAGGTGKTVTAVHLARQLAVQGKRVLCVCMELFPSRGWYEADGNGEGEAFSQLLYYAKTNPKWIPSKLEANRKKHPLWKFDFIPPLPNGAEPLEIGGEEITRLLTGLTETGNTTASFWIWTRPCSLFKKKFLLRAGSCCGSSRTIRCIWAKPGKRPGVCLKTDGWNRLICAAE